MMACADGARAREDVFKIRERNGPCPCRAVYTAMWTDRVSKVTGSAE